MRKKIISDRPLLKEERDRRVLAVVNAVQAAGIPPRDVVRTLAEATLIFLRHSHPEEQFLVNVEGYIYGVREGAKRWLEKQPIGFYDDLRQG
jgi:hypothetical protein